MDEFEDPIVGYFDDKKNPDIYVRLEVDIPGLKKAMMSQQPSNADIKLESTARTIRLTVVPKGQNSKILKYRYELNKLPADIVPDRTITKVKKDGEVVVLLHKANPDRWDRWLNEGLE